MQWALRYADSIDAVAPIGIARKTTIIPTKLELSLYQPLGMRNRHQDDSFLGFPRIRQDSWQGYACWGKSGCSLLGLQSACFLDVDPLDENVHLAAYLIVGATGSRIQPELRPAVLGTGSFQI